MKIKSTAGLGNNITTKVAPIVDMKIHIDDETGKVYLEGYANTKDHADSYGDIPHNLNGEPVYNLESMETNPICFVDHRWSAANIAGSFVELKEDDKGLWFRLLLRPLAEIFNPLVKDAVSAFMGGFGRALSIGGRWHFKDPDNENHLTKADIHEISIVGLGADDQALMDTPHPKNHSGEKGSPPFADLPLADRDRPWDSAAALGRVREWAGIVDDDGALADPDVQRRYRRAFFWYDEADAGEFGAYKLSFADVIDGELTAVPRGVFAAAAALRGARGGVFIPDGSLPNVIRHVERYYEKMGVDSPFNGGRSFRVDDIARVDERSFEQILKDGACFSNQDSKKIISALKSSGFRDEGVDDLRDGEKDAAAIKDVGILINGILNQFNA